MEAIAFFSLTDEKPELGREGSLSLSNFHTVFTHGESQERCAGPSGRKEGSDRARIVTGRGKNLGRNPACLRGGLSFGFFTSWPSK